MPVSFAQQAHRALGVGFADPLQQHVQVRAAQDRPGEQREQFGLLRRVPGFPGPFGRTVDKRGDGDGHQQQHDDGDGAVRLGDGERVPRLDKEVVEQQPGEHRGKGRGRDAAEQRDNQHPDKKQRALTANPEPWVEQQHYHRTDRGRNHKRGKPRHQMLLAR